MKAHVGALLQTSTSHTTENRYIPPMLHPYKITKYLFLALLSFSLVLGIGGVPGYSALPHNSVQSLIEEMNAEPSKQSSILEIASNSLTLEQQAQQLYETGQFAQSVQVLKQAIANSNGNGLEQARQLRNLALAYHKLGELNLANEAIQDSLNRLTTEQILGNETEVTRLLAQALEVKGQLHLSLGQPEQALDTWKQAAENYQKISDSIAITRSQINQAQALQTLGLYRQAIRTLNEVRDTLQEQPDSLVKAKGLQSLGEALRVVGNLEQAQAVLQQSLEVAERLQMPDSIAAILITLGNTAYVQKKSDVALKYYQRAALEVSSPTTQIQALLNQVKVLGDDQKQQEKALALVPQIQSLLTNLPPSRTAIYARINLAESFGKLQSQQSEALLVTAVEQAQTLDDKRAEAYALGSLGAVYEKNQQWEKAQHLTEQALLLAQTIEASDIAYQWQWQLGRILQVQGDRAGAIATYTEAVETLGSLRSDLIAISSDVQFSFRKSVEPIYRELVSLLLQRPSQGEVSQTNLVKARDVIESLQLAELDNFFRDACIDAKPVKIDEIDKTAAIFYPIILSDRLEVIVALPGQPLRQYTTFLSKDKVEETLKTFRRAATIPGLGSLKRFSTISQQVYDWLIRPVETELASSGIKTLAFVPDGFLRNVPLSALYDGKQYLVQQYSVAIAPGLQLVDPQPLAPEQLKVLAFGVSEARQEFEPLPNVELELNGIKAEVESQVRLNESFTNSEFQQDIDLFQFPVVHLATHGQFSSDAEQTFVLAWDDKITAREFTDILSVREGLRTRPIELLVLSACQTAEGDDRAALGLAGVAVRAGARSTLASLWSINDEATSLLMTQFYEELTTTQATKAEALRAAQEMMLQNAEFFHPYYWSAFVLVGNWM